LCQCHHFLSGLLSAVTKRIPCFIGSDLVFNEPSDLILNYHKQRVFQNVVEEEFDNKNLAQMIFQDSLDIVF